MLKAKRTSQKTNTPLAVDIHQEDGANFKRPKTKKLIFSLRDNGEELHRARLICRPSRRNKSPYVADIELLEDNNRTAICHVPNLDMGGKCAPGATLLVKPARDRKGNKVPADAINPKFGTPKCEFISQLLLVDDAKTVEESEPKDQSAIGTAQAHYEPTWMGAHPSLGERIARHWLEQSAIDTTSPVNDIQSQVKYGDNMRCDFLVTHADGTLRYVEVKTVVDTDYHPQAVPPVKCRFVGTTNPSYLRTGIFPWGSGKQKGPEGEAVVSARAIAHVRHLTSLVKQGDYHATILFCVIRGDAQAFRPNRDACPSFAHYLQKAYEAGVQVLAKRVSWDDKGNCYDDELSLAIEWG